MFEIYHLREVNKILIQGKLSCSVKSIQMSKSRAAGFNCKYLQDVIGAVNDEFIRMNIKTSNSPCIFDQVDGEDYLFLVLPMRVSA